MLKINPTTGKLDLIAEIGDVITGGASGSIIFIDANRKLAQNNSNLFWDDTNLRLGIGTTAPSGRLHLFGANVGNVQQYFERDQASVNSHSLGQLIFRGSQSGATNKNRIGAQIDATADGSWATDNANYAPTDIRFFTQDASTTNTLTSPRLIIKSNGNVGIGTTAPSKKLEVIGGARFASEHASWTFDETAATRLGFIKKGGYNPWLAAITGQPITFGHTSSFTNVSGAVLSAKMIIDGSGNVGIGTSTPDTLLHVFQTGSGDVAKFSNATSSELLVIKNDGNVGIGSANFSTNNGNVGRILKIGSNDNNVIISQSANLARALILEHRKTGRATSERVAQIQLGDDGVGAGNGLIQFYVAPLGSDVYEIMRIQASNSFPYPYGRVGIGAGVDSSLDTLLQVGGDTDGSFSVYDSNPIQIFYADYSQVSVSDQLGQPIFYADRGTGRVGIGTSNPNYRLHIVGALGFKPGSSVMPINNGDVVIEATNNTTLKFKLKGSDGVVRSVTLTLS